MAGDVNGPPPTSDIQPACIPSPHSGRIDGMVLVVELTFVGLAPGYHS